MSDLPTGAAHLAFDGGESASGTGPGRRFMIDTRCLRGEPVHGDFAHVCALPDAAAALAYDQPEIQQVRRDALAWWIALLGDALVCLTTLALDVAPPPWESDPKEIAIDALHHAVYAAFTGLAFAGLQRSSS